MLTQRVGGGGRSLRIVIAGLAVGCGQFLSAATVSTRPGEAGIVVEAAQFVSKAAAVACAGQASDGLIAMSLCKQAELVADGPQRFAQAVAAPEAVMEVGGDQGAQDAKTSRDGSREDDGLDVHVPWLLRKLFRPFDVIWICALQCVVMVSGTYLREFGRYNG